MLGGMDSFYGRLVLPLPLICECEEENFDYSRSVMCSYFAMERKYMLMSYTYTNTR
jgi:hypothetical protein